METSVRPPCSIRLHTMEFGVVLRLILRRRLDKGSGADRVGPAALKRRPIPGVLRVAQGNDKGQDNKFMMIPWTRGEPKRG
jgi:hypothetical protein